MQLEKDNLRDILKRRLTQVGIDSLRYSWKSFRIGMVGSVIKTQGKGERVYRGVVYADGVIEYIERMGRWTNSK